ncbi:hypothetical protein THII_3620 [Thioploca ingrica]|uniref:Uncharacterized protein n=1 Tax=Thioploca ingrica TaxID=40754 RepID=A0A090ANY9_9GAMM|nr:hypothetical protein THII_3620 [Thioploca ingrica]
MATARVVPTGVILAQVAYKSDDFMSVMKIFHNHSKKIFFYLEEIIYVEKYETRY